MHHQVAARWLACCLRTTSLGQRNRCALLLAKLWQRIRTAAAAAIVRCVIDTVHQLYMAGVL